MSKDMCFAHQRLGRYLVFVSAIFCIGLYAAHHVHGGTAPGDEPVSLNVENKPLGEVLEVLTKATGHAFIIDEQWLNLKVSLAVDGVPLHKVLKLIFADLNNAIIYRADGNIKIMVYSESSSEARRFMPQPMQSKPELPFSSVMRDAASTYEESEPDPQPEAAADAEREDEAQPSAEQETETEQESLSEDEIKTEKVGEEQDEGTEETAESQIPPEKSEDAAQDESSGEGEAASQ